MHRWTPEQTNLDAKVSGEVARDLSFWNDWWGVNTMTRQKEGGGIREDWFEAMVRDNEHILYAYFFRRTGFDSGIAMDLTQSTFESALGAKDRLNSAVDSPGAWIMTIARRRLVDHYRKGHIRRVRTFLANPSRHPRAPLLEDVVVEVDVVSRVLMRLPPRYAVVLILRYVDGLSNIDVANELNRTPKSVESATVRARAMFRTAYRKESEQ